MAIQLQMEDRMYNPYIFLLGYISLHCLNNVDNMAINVGTLWPFPYPSSDHDFTISETRDKI